MADHTDAPVDLSPEAVEAMRYRIVSHMWGTLEGVTWDEAVSEGYDPENVETVRQMADAAVAIVLPALTAANARADRLEAENARLRGLMWHAWHEMNAIRARSGVPLDFDGKPQGIGAVYWSNVVDRMDEALSDDAKPWPSNDARAALAPKPTNPEDAP